MMKAGLVLLSFIVCGLFLAVVLVESQHGHSHGHGHEPHGHGHGHHGHGHSHGEQEYIEPDDYEHEDHRHLYFKPKEEEVIADEAVNTKEQEHDLKDDHHDDDEEVHDAHEHSHDHEDSHDHHGHSHDHHGHSHDHHSHGEDKEIHKHEKRDEHSHHHDEKHEGTKLSTKRFELWTWINALGATLLISAAPYLLLFFIPLEKGNDEQKPLLKVLLSFASGGLLGDAFLHLIPHAVSPHSHTDGDHSHSHSAPPDHDRSMVVGLWVLGGIVTFLMVEKFVRFVKGGHSHSHSHVVIVPDPSEKAKTEGGETDSKEGEKTAEESQETKTDDKSDKKGDCDNEHDDIKVAGYLNLAADFTHNFTDGLAIGASFLVHRNLGIVTTVTILLHEVPHEIGDFAILIQSGCSKRKAMLLQLTTATGAMAGTICGLLAEGVGGSAATLWILPFTAGGFIYIATVSVIPELLGDTKLWQSIKEIIALIIGIFMMVLIAKLE